MALPGKGRNMLLRLNGVNVAGLMAKSIAIANEPIDITSDDDAGWRKLLDAVGSKQITISGNGVAKDDGMLQIAMKTEDIVNPFDVVFPDGSTLGGDFALTSLTRSGEHNGAVLFEFELQSTGAQTYSGT